MLKKGGNDSDSDSMPEDLTKVGFKDIMDKKRKAGANKREMQLVTDTDLLKRFYGDEGQLDQTDKFLRNYILLQCWKDKGDLKASKVQESIDKEDEARDGEMDDYEQKYNFRFEEGTGAYLTTHTRAVEDSMRRKDDKRKDKRQDKKDRVEDEKRRKQEEIQQLKSMKRDEIIEKLRKAEFISGSHILEDKRLLEKVEKELKTDFIPELYDKAMDKMFNAKYYDQEDAEADHMITKRGIDLKLMNDEEIPDRIRVSKDDQSEEGEASQQEEINDEQYEREISKSLKKQIKASEEEEGVQQGYETWFACDGCQKAIESGDYRFDCTSCDNFCFCEKCYKKNKTHMHKFTRQKVPFQMKPPKNNKDLLKKAYMLCNTCGDCLLEQSKSVYVCHTCSGDFKKGDIIYFCLKCKKDEANAHEHKLSKFKGVLP